HNRFDPPKLPVIHRKAGDVTHSGQHAKNILERAEFAHHFELRQEIVEIELRRAQLSLQSLFFFFIDDFGCFFDQPDDVAHPENAASQAVRYEDFELIELFADAGEFDRAMRHFAHRKRRATARVTIELGQNDSCDLECVV